MLDLIFPNICPFCESISEDRKLCKKCVADISYIDERAVCLRCGVPFRVFGSPGFSSNTFAESGTSACMLDGQLPAVIPIVRTYSNLEHFCGRCLRGEFIFDKARSAAYYDGLLREVLHRFKYGGKLALGGVLARIMCENYPPSFKKVELVVPVPLHVSKLRKREFNQSVILASYLTKKLGVALDPFVISKLKETRPQVEVSDEDERKRNVKGAFSVLNPAAIKRKSILLIDDIFTTGSTVNECTRVLLRGGASIVQVLTLMRASQR